MALRFVSGSASISGHIGAAVAGLLIGTGAVAEGGDASGAQSKGVIEEIIVTAQKRSQNLQEVPVSITVLTGEDIDTYRLRDPADLIAHVPNMQNYPITGAGTPVFSLRGVSMRDFSFNQASPVAVYIDEVYKGNPSLLAVPLFDVERVEVLRGPQGTLYGKNITGGVVNFHTRRPGTENANYVSMGAGNYGLIEAETAFDIALSDELAVRLAGTYAEADVVRHLRVVQLARRDDIKRPQPTGPRLLRIRFRT